VNAPFDYQIGGGYRPPSAVRVVARDREDRPAEGRYTICYVNAFQAQPDELAWWQRAHPDLLLRDAGGALVIDRDWDEALLDISTADRRERLAGIVGAWTDGCAERGFAGVEFDNLDSFTRSGGRLDARDAVAFAALLTERAHERGLAAAQKNTAELLGDRERAGFDFAVTEDCARYDECGAYIEAYDRHVVDVEYEDADFRTACERWGEAIAVVRRDRDVTPRGRPGHVYRSC
jgi:hypothetical protein